MRAPSRPFSCNHENENICLGVKRYKWTKDGHLFLIKKGVLFSAMAVSFPNLGARHNREIRAAIKYSKAKSNDTAVEPPLGKKKQKIIGASLNFVSLGPSLDHLAHIVFIRQAKRNNMNLA